ncbi:MAG TPA: threonine synthase, partial [Candidatus Polarisedimenticolia bacterium]|nr:threonine synthase [Candidatus Polarisedimenticolia bacterium]
MDQIQQVCKSDGGPLLVRYDLRRVRDSLTKDALRDRPETLWRYRELLPHEGPDDEVSLGEQNTPLLETPSLGLEIGLPKLRVKDEGLLPTGTFKARGAAVGVT